MGQNQDKIEEGEELPSKKLVGTGEKGNQTGDVMEGGSSCDEEAANTEGKCGEPGVLDFGPGQKPTTPTTEKPINLWVSPSTLKEVRQGGAVGTEGGGIGEGVSTASLVSQNTYKNQKKRLKSEDSARTSNHFDQIEKKAGEEIQSSNLGMEYQTEGTVQDEEEDFPEVSHGLTVTSVDANTKVGSDVMRIRRAGAKLVVDDNFTPKGRMESLPSAHRGQSDTMMAEAREDEDLKKFAGTVCHFRDRKELPPTKPQHPLKNTVQNQPLLDMSEAIHCNPPKEKTEGTTKWKTLMFDEGSNLAEEINYSFKKATADGQQSGSLSSYQNMDAVHTYQTVSSFSLPSPERTEEPSSILEKLLRRNKTEATSSLSKIKEITTDYNRAIDSDVGSDHDAAGMSTGVTYHLQDKSVKANHATEDQQNQLDVKQIHTAAHKTYDGVYCQPGVTGNISKSSELCHHNSDIPKQDANVADPLVKEEVEIMPNNSAGNNVSPKSHEKTACNVVHEIDEEPTTSVKRQVFLKKSKSLETQSVKIMSSESTATSTADACSGLVMTEVIHQVSTDRKSGEKILHGPQKAKDDSVVLRDKPQSASRPRPVSELIKESIQIHEKLQQQERTKTPEVKNDEHGQSVIVAQMKAAFDSAQKSPDKAVERKPSMRKGKSMKTE